MSGEARGGDAVNGTVWSVPNLLTLSRLLAAPVVAALIIGGNTVAAAAVFAAAAATDWLDGQVARRTGATTRFGTMFDPLVDRIFIGSAAVAILFTDFAPPLWAVALLVGRDLLLVAGFRLLKSRGIKLPPIAFVGKMATALIMVAVPLLVVLPSVGIVLFYAGLSLSLLAGLSYVVQGIKSLTAA